MTKRVHYRRDDRIIHPGSTREQIVADYAVAPFDEAARAMDLKWGVGRLPKLVPEAMAAKFGAAVAHMNACLDREDAAAAGQAAENCRKGFTAMDAAATASGAVPLPKDVLQYELEGELYTIAKDIDAWPSIAQDMPGVRLWSMREAALALQRYGTIVAAIKDSFPGAQISEIREKRTPLAQSLNDDVPFGPERRLP